MSHLFFWTSREWTRLLPAIEISKAIHIEAEIEALSVDGAVYGKQAALLFPAGDGQFMLRHDIQFPEHLGPDVVLNRYRVAVPFWGESQVVNIPEIRLRDGDTISFGRRNLIVYKK